MNASDPPRRWRRVALHLLRVAMFVAVIALIHLQHKQVTSQRQDQPLAPVDVHALREFFPEAHSVADEGQGDGRREVLDSSGKSLGYILQTPPHSDHLIGFSGPTSALIAFGSDDRIVGIVVLSSGDTREHVAQVLRDDTFLKSFNRLTRDEVRHAEVDAVSGATLTSLAIQESIIHRLGGAQPSLRFPDPLVVDDARTVFESAHSIEQDEEQLSLWHVKDEQGHEIGSILRTSPAADNTIGYQGPTEARICFDFTGRIVGISIGKSYDNEPYVTYVREDEYFLTLFNDLKLEDLASLDLEERKSKAFRAPR